MEKTDIIFIRHFMVSTIFLDFGADNKEIAYIGELFFKKVYCVSVA